MGKPTPRTKKPYPERDLENRVSLRVPVSEARRHLAERVQLAKTELQKATLFRASAAALSCDALLKEAERQVDSLKFVVQRLQQEEEALTASTADRST